jgi:post-segregation antitoxin (ccd killing protein)
MEESLRATRLSGNTAMAVDSLEITATGEVVLDAGALVLKVSGTTEVFVLKEASTKAGAKTALVRLREALASGTKVVSVTGNVEGWNGRFPAVLGALAKQPADAQMALLVTGFEIK